MKLRVIAIASFAVRLAIDTQENSFIRQGIISLFREVWIKADVLNDSQILRMSPRNSTAGGHPQLWRSYETWRGF